MNWADRLAGGLRVLAAFVVYTAAVQALRTAIASQLLLGVVGLVVMVAVLGAVDLARVAVTGDRRLLRTGGYLYSARGLVVLLVFFLLSAALAGVLEGWLPVASSVAFSAAIVLAVAVVFGGLTGFYWWRSLRPPERSDGQ